MAGPLTRLGLGDESPEQRQQRITAGVMASVYRQVPQSVLGSIFGSMALVAAFWHTHDQNQVLQNQLLIWFIGMLLESLLRLRVARAFRLDPEPAKRAKMERGDVILEYDAHTVANPTQFRNLVAQTPVGR